MDSVSLSQSFILLGSYLAMNSTIPTLRPYQKEAVRRVIQHFQRSDEPAVVVLPTGSGKSLVIADLARRAKGRVLVLAHVRELVEQNHAKYEAYGIRADIYSAGLNARQSARQVVFASVQSVVKALPKFTTGEFTLLVIDECHRVPLPDERSRTLPKASGSVQRGQKAGMYADVIEALRKANPRLKVLGLTATPYRLGQGFIYQRHYHGRVCGSDSSFFKVCVFEQPLRLMVKQGYLSPPRRIDAAVEGYDFSQLIPSAQGEFTEKALQGVVDHHRATPEIIKEVIARAHDRQGVMIFAATIPHAEEIMTLLPAGEAALVTGKTPLRKRTEIIERFKHKALRYLVNVAVLTTGFDAPHVDMIAILRPTASIGLYQQIVGRGLRLAPDKQDCLILDYAGNPWDLYAPEVGEAKPAPDTEPVQVECPACGFANIFWGRRDGEFVIEHFGRRCQGWCEDEQGAGHQCTFRFRFKSCPQCGEENDIAARQCHACQARLIDPDDQLKAALKLRDALVLRVSGMQLEATVNGKGLPRLRVTYHDEDGATLSEWFALETSTQRHVFQEVFLKRHLAAPGIVWSPATLDDVLAGQQRLRAPDFVIGWKVGRHWQIREKLFDYALQGGRYRRAASAQ